MTLRATLDANVLISGLAYGGVPGLVLDHGIDAQFVLILASEPLSEVENKLLRKLNKPHDFVSRALSVLHEAANLVDLQERIEVCRDHKDNHVLECAVAGQADIIVTGDKDLLVLHLFRGIRILTPRQFLDELQPTTPPQPLP